MSLKENDLNKNQFLFIDETFIACQGDKVVAYCMEGRLQEFRSEEIGFGSIKILYTVHFPLPESETHVRPNAPVAIFESTEDLTHAFLIWESGHIQVFDIRNGLTLHLYNQIFGAAFSRLISVRHWYQDQFLFVTSNVSESSYDAWVYDRAGNKLHGWDSLPSSQVGILFRIESNENIKIGAHNESPVPEGIVCVTSDRSGLQWCNTHEDQTWQNFKVPSRSEAKISWFGIHPKEPSLFAVTNTSGELFIIKGISAVDCRTNICYSSKRWHSRGIKAAHWYVDTHGFDNDTLLTGGDEGVLCIWSARSLRLTTIPRIPGPITAIIQNLTNPSQVMVRIGTNTLIVLDITEKRIIAEYPYISSSFQWGEYKNVKKVTFANKRCFFLFNSSSDDIRIMNASTHEILFNIPTASLRNSVILTNENSLFNPKDKIIEVDIVRYRELEVIVIYEFVPMLHQNNNPTTSLRFVYYNSRENTFTRGGVIHEPHSASLHDKSLVLSSQDSSCGASKTIMCVHPFSPVLLTGIKSEFKLWMIREEENSTGTSQISWFCFAIHFQGVHQAKFTNDGAALGVWEFSSNKFFLYDSEILFNDSLLNPLFSIDLGVAEPNHFWPKKMIFVHNDSQCVMTAGNDVYVLHILQKNSKDYMLHDETVLVGAVLLDTQNSNLLVVGSSKCLRMYDCTSKSLGSDSLKCVFSKEWLLCSHDVQIRDGIVFFDTQSEGYLYILFSRSIDKSKSLLKKFKFNIQKATLQPMEIETNTSMKREKFGVTSNPDLTLVVKGKDPCNTLKVIDYRQKNKLDIDIALSSSSFKLPPLSILTRKLWEEKG